MRLPPAVPMFLAVLLAADDGTAAQTKDDFGLAMTRLELTLDLDYSDGSLAGWALYEIANLSSASVTEVPFNLGRLMTVRAASGPEGAPLGFTEDVAVFSDSRMSTRDLRFRSG